MLTKYEVVVILDDRKHDDGGEKFADDLGEFVVAAGGEVLERKKLGRMQLAHPIKRRNNGLYWDVVMNLPGSQVAALKDKYRLDPVVLRLEVFLYDKPDSISLKPVAEPAESSAETANDAGASDDSGDKSVEPVAAESAESVE